MCGSRLSVRGITSRPNYEALARSARCYLMGVRSRRRSKRGRENQNTLSQKFKPYKISLTHIKRESPPPRRRGARTHTPPKTQKHSVASIDMQRRPEGGGASSGPSARTHTRYSLPLWSGTHGVYVDGLCVHRPRCRHADLYCDSVVKQNGAGSNPLLAAPASVRMTAVPSARKPCDAPFCAACGGWASGAPQVLGSSNEYSNGLRATARS